MNSREWFEGVLGWAQPQAEDGEFIQAIQSPEGKLYVTTPPIWECQSAWIEYVVKPMRGMGYVYDVRAEYKYNELVSSFSWIDTKRSILICNNTAQIIDDQIFQASLDAAEKCPEVKERLQDFRESGKI